MFVPMVFVPTPTGNLIFSCAATLCPFTQHAIRTNSVAIIVWDPILPSTRSNGSFVNLLTLSQHTIVERREERQGRSECT